MNLSRPGARPGMAHWEARWSLQRNQSLLKQTQRITPELWEHFYNEVAGIWDKMTGLGNICEQLVDQMLCRNLVKTGDTILDLGCGPGNLSLALAQKKIHVTALDQSKGMIQVLNKRINFNKRPEGMDQLYIQALTGDWNVLPGKAAHGVVIAAFFPETCSAQGLHRMEMLASQTCILILGDGRETFPLRKQIWEKIMPVPCQAHGFHLECAQNYLKAAGRRPGVMKLSLPVELDVDAHEVRSYFRAYFKMFDVLDEDLNLAVEKALSPHLEQGRVCIKGRAHLAAIFWQVPKEPGDPGEPDESGGEIPG